MSESVVERSEGTNVPLSFVVTLVGGILTFASVVFLQAVYFGVEDREQTRKRGSGVPQEVRESRREQLEQLEGYRWIDREQGIVAIPVERAKELFLEEESSPASR